jgi:hypothetical protein
MNQPGTGEIEADASSGWGANGEPKTETRERENRERTENEDLRKCSSSVKLRDSKLTGERRDIRLQPLRVLQILINCHVTRYKPWPLQTRPQTEVTEHREARKDASGRANVGISSLSRA